MSPLRKKDESGRGKARQGPRHCPTFSHSGGYPIRVRAVAGAVQKRFGPEVFVERAATSGVVWRSWILFFFGER